MINNISGNFVRLLLRTPAVSAAEEEQQPPPPQREGEPEAWEIKEAGHAGILVSKEHDSRHRLGGSAAHCRRRGGGDPGDMTSSGVNRGPPHNRPAKRRIPLASPFSRGWTVGETVALARRHPIPCAFALSLLFFMGVEYTLRMVPPTAPPFDVGFLLTRPLHRLLAVRPALNSALAALNTVFVGMQGAYILGTLLLEGRPRPAISALFMFTCRGILGYTTQLPLPKEFLGSGADFPVGNVSFFLFFSGHVAGAVIASLEMRRTGRRGMAVLFDALNLLQGLRLLATRGHYTIDLATGVGAGFLFDVLAGMYEESRAPAAAVDDADEVDWRAARGCSACTCRE